MAIQVGGTTVIDNSRNLQNVGGLKTINSASILGSGDISAGASTTAGGVGTYVYGRPFNNTSYAAGNTASNVQAYSPNSIYVVRAYPGQNRVDYGVATTMSGTWRCMSRANGNASYAWAGLWIRIS